MPSLTIDKTSQYVLDTQYSVRGVVYQAAQVGGWTCARACCTILRGRGVYAVRGTVSEEFGCISVEAQWMEKLPVIQDPRYAEASTVTRIRANEHQRSRRSSRWQH